MEFWDLGYFEKFEFLYFLKFFGFVKLVLLWFNWESNIFVLGGKGLFIRSVVGLGDDGWYLGVDIKYVWLELGWVG